MKTFIFSTHEKNARYGSLKVTAQVYRIKNNKPVYIGSTQWNTASFKGENSEVMNFLTREKEIPKKNYGYYYNRVSNFRMFKI